MSTATFSPQLYRVALALPHAVRRRSPTDEPLDPVTGMAIALCDTDPPVALTIVTPDGSIPSDSLWPSDDLRIEIESADTRPCAPTWEVLGAFQAVDLVHVFQPFTRFGEISILAAKALNRKVCVSDMFTRVSDIGLSLGILDLVDAVIPGSEFESLLHPTNMPMQIVRGGVDTTFFAPSPDAADRSDVLYMAGSLSPAELERITGSDSLDLPAVICTATDIRAKEFRDRCRSALAVIFASTGPVRSIAPELLGPQAVFQAMACGAPVIAIRGSSAAEAVAEGATGFLVDRIEEVPAIIRMLAHSSTLSNEIGAAGRAAALREFSTSRVGQQIRRVYDTIVRANGSVIQ